MSRNPIPSLTRCVVYRRDRFRCRYCASRVTYKTGTLDHLIPVCEWGPNAEWNLVTACWPCNSAKGSKSLEELGWHLLPEGMTKVQVDLFGIKLPNYPERYRRGRRSKKNPYLNRPSLAA